MRNIGVDLLIFLASNVLAILILQFGRWLSARSGGSMGDGPEELRLHDLLLATAIAVLWVYGKTSLEAGHLLTGEQALKLVIGYTIAVPLYACLGTLMFRIVRAGGFGQIMGIMYAMLVAGGDIASAMHLMK